MKTRVLFSSMAGLLVLTSCVATPAAPTPDIGLIQTSAAQTVVANFTLTAAITSTAVPTETQTQVPLVPSGTASTDTPTLLPGGVTATPILCDALIYDSATIDVNVPDNTEMQLGQKFVKTWQLKTTAHALGERATGSYLAMGIAWRACLSRFTGVVAPRAGGGGVRQLHLRPTKAGAYVSFWQMANANGTPFPRPIYVKIVVK